jgi:hypothetical protein
METQLDSESKSWHAFAEEKLAEAVAPARLLEGLQPRRPDPKSGSGAKPPRKFARSHSGGQKAVRKIAADDF